jgi:cyclic nucleotide-binding protein/MFS transporter
VLHLGAVVGPAAASIRMTIEDGDLRRLLAAWFASNAGKWAFVVVTWVLAFDAGGAWAVGILGLAQFVPRMVVAPFAGIPTARWRPESVLRAALVVRVVATLAAATVIAADLSLAALYLVVVIEAGAAAFNRPVYLALLPAVARTPAQLVGANVASSAAENLGAFAGPAIVGLLLALSGPLGATLAIAATYGLAVASIAKLEVPLVGRAHPDARAIAGQLLDAVRIAAGDVGPRIVFIGVAFQTVVRGMLGVLIVVVSLELLGLGDAGVGTLTAAIGLGGLFGAAIATLMASGVRLGNAFVASLAAWGLPILVIGLVVDPVIALLAILVVGMSNAVFDVSVDTLLQRTVPHTRQVAVIGLLELVISGGMALGGLLAPVLIGRFGIETALIATGGFLPLVALASWPTIRRVDESGLTDPHRIDRIRGEPMFAPLSLATVEHLASRLELVRFDDGDYVIRQGDPGRTFFLIDEGSAEVSRDGQALRILGPGAGFGEIALLDDVPRTASVRAIGPVAAFSIDRDEFLEAVTGHVVSRSLAHERTVDLRAADAERLALH